VEDFPVHAAIDISGVRELKAEASRCHESQGGLATIRGFMGWVIRLGDNKETYMRAYPSPEPGVVERDLFKGIEIQ
jgi:hypothetical protein